MKELTPIHCPLTTYLTLNKAKFEQHLRDRDEVAVVAELRTYVNADNIVCFDFLNPVEVKVQVDNPLGLRPAKDAIIGFRMFQDHLTSPGPWDRNAWLCMDTEPAVSSKGEELMRKHEAEGHSGWHWANPDLNATSNQIKCLVILAGGTSSAVPQKIGEWNWEATGTSRAVGYHLCGATYNAPGNGTCPVPNETHVIIRSKEGYQNSGKACAFDWNHIATYRVLP